MFHSPLRAVLLVSYGVSALVMCGCATVQVNDQWREASARENERIAALWRSSGAPSQAMPFEQQAERDRLATRKNRTGLLESIVDSLIIGWVEAPQRSGRR
jgi:hypothetical protein